MGSDNGLDKYDGYNVTNFASTHNLKNPEFLKNINNIMADNKGNLWISSSLALSCLNLRTEKLKYFFSSESDSIKGTYKTYFDSVSNCIFGYSRNGKIFRFNTITYKYSLYKYDSLNPNSIPKGGIMDIKSDNKQNIYFTFWANGISKYNRKFDSFTNFLPDEKNPNSASKYSVFALSSDKYNNIWSVSADEARVQKFDPISNKFTHKTPPKELEFSSNVGIVADNSNNLWICNSGHGLMFYDTQHNLFSLFKHENDNPESLSESRAGSCYVDYNNILWVSTLNKGVNKLNLNLQGVKYYTVPNKYLKLSAGILHYLEDINYSKWVCNEDGVFKINTQTNDFIKIDLPKNDRYSRLIDLFDGTILVNGNEDFYVLDTKTLKSKKVNITIDEKKINTISNSYLDSKNRLWLVFRENLCVFENGINSGYKKIPISKNISGERYFYTNFLEYNNKLCFINEQYVSLIDINSLIEEKININKKLEDRRITSIYKTRDSIYLTRTDGYVSTDLKFSKFNLFKYGFLAGKEVIPISYFYNDSMQCLTTYRGLYIYNMRTKKYVQPKIFNPDKINPDNFFRNKFDKTFSLAAGTGYIKFDPKSLEKSAQKPSILLSGFYLFNTQIEIGGPDSPLKESISYTTEITLNHKQNVFSIEMTLINFDEVHKNSYAYKLEGFDKDWNYIGPRKVASFTNLEAGNYTFIYKAKDKNGTFSDVKSLKINILPPFWETWWFRLLAIIVFCTVIYLVYWFRTRTIRNQKIELEQQVILRTAEILAQNEEILAQRDAIEVHQKEIIELYDDIRDSITTAQRIQESILPSETLIKQCLPDSFIIYLPKDVVSGDLYWFYVDLNHYYIAAIDCTGHGVAGAFMSLIAHNLLNKIMGEEKDLSPKQILDRLNSYLIQVLNQESDDAISKDGMDASICKISLSDNKLEFAGANNALYYIRNGELQQIKADKNSVGIQPLGKIAHFENHVFEFQKNDMFYMFSDGFVGQFGGENGQEKMKFNRFRQVILDNSNFDMNSQKQNILKYLQEFKGNTEQTDDILLIGFKV